MQQGKSDVLFHPAGRNARALGDLRLAQAFEAMQHKGFSPAGREFAEDFFYLLPALQALRGDHKGVSLVGARLGIRFDVIRVNGGQTRHPTRLWR